MLGQILVSCTSSAGVDAANDVNAGYSTTERNIWHPQKLGILGKGLRFGTIGPEVYGFLMACRWVYYVLVIGSYWTGLVAAAALAIPDSRR